MHFLKAHILEAFNVVFLVFVLLACLLSCVFLFACFYQNAHLSFLLIALLFYVGFACSHPFSSCDFFL
jgi:hypothetical protein